VIPVLQAQLFEALEKASINEHSALVGVEREPGSCHGAGSSKELKGY
jgi:hypothetical protein